MYYISMCDNSRWQYEVTDTDTGKSVSVSYTDLQEMWRSGKIIKGVSLSDEKISASDPQLHIEFYASSSPLLAKDLILRGYSFICSETTLKGIKVAWNTSYEVTLNLDRNITILGESCIKGIPQSCYLTLKLHDGVTKIHKHFCGGTWDKHFYLDVTDTSTDIKRQAYYVAGLANRSNTMKFFQHIFDTFNQILDTGIAEQDAKYFYLEGCYFGVRCTCPNYVLTPLEQRFLKDHKKHMLSALRLASCSIPKVEDYCVTGTTGVHYKAVIQYLLDNMHSDGEVAHIRVVLLLLQSFGLDEFHLSYATVAFLYFFSGGTDEDIKVTKDFVLQNLLVTLSVRY